MLAPAVSPWTTFHALQRQHHLQRHRDVDRIAAVRNLIKACSDGRAVLRGDQL